MACYNVHTGTRLL